MCPTSNKPEKDSAQSAFNLTLAVVAGQAGCLTLVIVLVALFGGLWLDSRLQTRPLFTVGLMVASVPITLVTMFWVVRIATSRIMKSKQKTDLNQEADRGKTS